MVDQAVILAAGMGSRIRANASDSPKPLVRVAGLSMIARTVLTMRAAGIRRVVVVVGFMGDQVAAAIRQDPALAHAEIEIEIVNNAEYALANGVSVLAAAPHVDGPFVLSMADHIYDVSLVAQIAQSDMTTAGLHLCVDRRISEVYDIDDATKVQTDREQIVDIGKTIRSYDCIDCGVFCVSHELINELTVARASAGDCSLSDGVKRLAAQGRARVHDIGNAFWQDVDTAEARVRAEQELSRRPNTRRHMPVRTPERLEPAYPLPHLT